MIQLKRSSLALVSAGLLAMAPGLAQAAAQAQSIMQLDNFLLKDTATSTVLNYAPPGGDFAALLFTSTADIKSTLNGSTLSDTGSSSAGAPINLLAKTVGAPVLADNTFPVFPIPVTAGNQFAASDQNEIGAPITGLAIGTPAKVESASYVSLNGSGDGSATSNNGLNASFIFTAAHALGITMVFDALAYLEAHTSPGEKFPTNASADYKLQFVLEDLDTNTTVVNWTPDGILNGGGAGEQGVVEVSDPFSLNATRSRNAPFNGTSFIGAALGTKNSGTFNASTVGLVAGDSYQFTIRMNTLADAQVPEPATLALLGIGLLGMGAGISRRRKSV